MTSTRYMLIPSTSSAMIDSIPLPPPRYIGHPYYSALAIPVQSSSPHVVVVQSEDRIEQHRFEIGMG